jgi:hypothetical protein
VAGHRLVGAGALRTLTPNGINPFNERLPVTGGDLLGLRVGNPPSGLPFDFGGGASCAFTAGLGNTVSYGIGSSEPAVGATSTLGAPVTLNRLNVIAQLEADADGDGYGDETQDACPGSAGASAGCTPAPAPGPAQDTTAPAAKLSARRRDSIRDGRVAVWVTSTETATATAKGTLAIASQAGVHRLRTGTANLIAGKRERMLLRLSKQTRRAARRALRRGKRLRVRVSVTLRDAAGNTGSAKRTVRLKR